MKALLDYLPGPNVRSILTDVFAGRIDVVCVDQADSAGLRREVADSDVLLHVLKPVTSDFMAASKKLALIQKIGVGVDTIDLQSAAAKGVSVCNMPGTNTQAVAELALSFILAGVKRLKQLDAETVGGRGWNRGNEVFDGIGEISGATIGLIGYGAVAQRLAPALRALGAEVVAHSLIKVDDETRFVELNELLTRSDVISLHIPLVAETIRFLDAARIARLKRGAIIVNTARGGLIDEQALISALQTGQVAAAALDVFAEEPIARQNPLLSMPNVLVTPHIAWLTVETWRRSFAAAFENCERLRRGEPLLHKVI